MSDKQDKSKLLLHPTPEFRLSYPNLFKPSAIKGSDKLNYSMEMLFDKTTTDLSVLQAPIKNAIVAKWGPNKADWPTPLNLPIRDGDVPRINKQTKKKEVRPEHAGMWVVKASSSAEFNRPLLVGRDPSKPLENPNELYAGCYARAGLKAHAYEFADKNGVKFIIDAVQFVRDGEAIGGRKKAEDIFGVIEGDSGDAEFVSNDVDMGSEEQESFI